MPSSHQHQTEERDAAEAHVAKTKAAWLAASTAFKERMDEFTENAGHTGEARDFSIAIGKMSSAATQFHCAKMDLDALDRSIP